jgi:hypothetical protein
VTFAGFRLAGGRRLNTKSSSCFIDFILEFDGSALHINERAAVSSLLMKGSSARLLDVQRPFGSLARQGSGRRVIRLDHVLEECGVAAVLVFSPAKLVCRFVVAR